MAASPFGQTGGFAFGTPSQPASSPGLFGVSSTPFGAASTPAPAFGASTGFNFAASSTPAFGAAASAPAFGAASTPSFGAFSFSAASTPAFGASTAPAAGSSPGLFSTAAAPLFGSTTPAFGQSSPAPFGTSFAPGFSFASPGAFGSPAPSAFGGISGALAPAAGQQGGMFGASTQMAPVAFSSGFAPDAAIKEITEIRAAYTPNSPTFKFQHLFLNVVEDPAHRVKPANVDEIRWRQVLAQAGGPNNPDKLWPVQAVGFKDLLSRAAAQQQAIQENQQRLKSLTELAHRMSRQHSGELKGRTADVQKRHIELSNRLLHVTRLLDALESRLAGNLGYRGDVSRLKEQELLRQLAGVESELAPSSSSGLRRRLEAVAAAARLRSGGAAAAASGTAVQAKLDEKSLQQLFAVLKEHADGVRHLQEVLKRDQLDLQIMTQQLGQPGG